MDDRDKGHVIFSLLCDGEESGGMGPDDRRAFGALIASWGMTAEEAAACAARSRVTAGEAYWTAERMLEFLCRQLCDD